MNKNQKFSDQGFNGLLTIEIPQHGGVSLLRTGKESKEVIDWDNRKAICGIGTTPNHGSSLINTRNIAVASKHWPIKLWYITQMSTPSHSSLRDFGIKPQDAKPGSAVWICAGLHDLAHDWAGTQGRGRFTWKFESEFITASCQFNYEQQKYIITHNWKEKNVTKEQ